jgi:hypothetical protein
MVMLRLPDSLPASGLNQRSWLQGRDQFHQHIATQVADVAHLTLMTSAPMSARNKPA